jgi:hypothetical protein
MSNAPLMTAIASGLLALLGGFFVASLARCTEYEKWLRQEKGMAFASLLRELHDTRLAASNAMYDVSLPEIQRSIKANEQFAKLSRFVGVARLYMSDSSRQQLERHVTSVWLGATSDGGPANSAVTIRDSMKLIQELLEAELHSGASLLGHRPKK